MIVPFTSCRASTRVAVQRHARGLHVFSLLNAGEHMRSHNDSTSCRRTLHVKPRQQAAGGRQQAAGKARNSVWTESAIDARRASLTKVVLPETKVAVPKQLRPVLQVAARDARRPLTGMDGKRSPTCIEQTEGTEGREGEAASKQGRGQEGRAGRRAAKVKHVKRKGRRRVGAGGK